MTPLTGAPPSTADSLLRVHTGQEWAVMSVIMMVPIAPWKESYDQPRRHIKKQRHYFANKGLSSQGYGFSTGHVWM